MNKKISDCKIEKDTAYVIKKKNKKLYGDDVVAGKNNIQDTLALCMKSCKQNKECNYWSYNKKKKYCFLKRTKVKSTKWSGYISGSKGCDEEDQPYDPKSYNEPEPYDEGNAKNDC